MKRIKATPFKMNVAVKMLGQRQNKMAVKDLLGITNEQYAILNLMYKKGSVLFYNGTHKIQLAVTPQTAEDIEDYQFKKEHWQIFGLPEYVVLSESDLTVGNYNTNTY